MRCYLFSIVVLRFQLVSDHLIDVAIRLGKARTCGFYELSIHSGSLRNNRRCIGRLRSGFSHKHNGFQCDVYLVCLERTPMFL